MIEHLTQRLYGALYRVEELGERSPALSKLLRWCEELGLLDATEWYERIEIRNRLVHEYPLDASDRALALSGAIEQATAILADFARATAHIQTRKLLDPDHV